MNTLNPFGAKTIQIDNKITHSLPHKNPIFARPFSPLSFRTPPPPLSSSYIPIKASSSSPFNDSKTPETPKTLNPKNPFFQFLFSFLKPTLIASITATALYFTRFYFKHEQAIATLISSPPTAETNVTDTKALEEQLLTNPNDVNTLRNLMEIQIDNRKVGEAISTVNRLIELEPKETEWCLLKSHLHVYNEELELAKKGFNEILKKDAFRVEAYHGLVMVASQEESNSELNKIKEKVEEGMKMCEKDNKVRELRDFKLLLAQIWVMEGKYKDALKIYEELGKEEPGDFRPYLCQGIIYTLLKKKDEAEKCFEKYQRLVPQGHPYARYFDDNLMATKLFAQKVENERFGSKS